MSGSDRYSRQVRFAPLGRQGQEKLAGARAGVVGLGALGSVAAEQLVRAGIGYLRIIDRDFVELSNLQRQALYDEDDARRSLPKAVAAQRRLGRINADVRIEASVEDLNAGNVEPWVEDLDLVVDGLDNFETRFVLNDACRKLSKPWIYGAAVGSYGLVFPVLPGHPCLRCIAGSLPEPGSPTCDTEGVIAPITNVIGSLEVSLAMRILAGRLEARAPELVSVDVWTLKFRAVSMPATLMEDCPLCAEGRFDYLSSEPLRSLTLCGRNAVQLIPRVRSEIDLGRLAGQLEIFGDVWSNEFLLKCVHPPYELTLFRDGRAIIKGTEEPSVARSLYARMIGS